jgi:hypothetical protein
MQMANSKEKLRKRIYGKILVLLSLVPLSFLVYTVLNLGNLGITVFHPRVIVEFALFAGFLISGIVLYFKRH